MKFKIIATILLLGLLMLGWALFGGSEPQQKPVQSGGGLYLP